MKKLNVAFCGTPDFSVPTLELLLNHPNINLKRVITMPDRAAGRGKALKSPPVAEFAKANKIPLIQTENINRTPEDLESLKNDDLDFIVVLAFAQFLGKKVLEMPKMGCFNIHTSILPKYRGAAPIQYALMNGDKSSGVSIQKMVKKMDAGDIVHFDELAISDEETGGQLYTRLKFQAALSINHLIGKILTDEVVYTKQNENDVSFAPTLSKEDGKLDFENNTYEEIHNKVRALKPWPGTYTFVEGKRLKVIEVSPETTTLKPNELSTKFGTLVVGTKDKCIRLKTVQLEGKKITSDSEMLNGLKNKLDISKIKLG